jgi:glycosyltransferase involved in cell wall biosynthesis
MANTHGVSKPLMTHETAPSLPRISVVIPTFNGGELLRRCLVALRAEQPPVHEIIVVDDASTDDSAVIAEGLGARVIRRTENAGPAAARNDGALVSTGEVIWFLDSDTELRAEGVRRLSEYLSANPGIAAVIGSYDDTPSQPNPCSQFKNLFHHYVHQKGPEIVSSFWSGCGAIRREAFNAVGGFDAEYWREPMIEDIHLGYELGKRGLRIGILKSLQVTHHKKWTLWSMVKTDLFHRAIPWTVILLRNRKQGSKELNLDNNYRISVILVYTAILAMIAAPLLPDLLLVAALLLLLVIPLNIGLLSFFLGRRGPLFFVRSVALLWLYFFYCGLGLMLGIVRYLREEAARR